MKWITRAAQAVLFQALFGFELLSLAGELDVDLTGYRPECGVNVVRVQERLTIEWPLERSEVGQVVFDLRHGRPLIGSIGIKAESAQPSQLVLRELEPVTFVV